MEANPNVCHHWEDVVFENRNKHYGAYLLRKAYAQRLLSGAGVTIFLLTLILFLHHLLPDDRVGEVHLPPIGDIVTLWREPIILRDNPVAKTEKQPKRIADERNVLVTRAEVTPTAEQDAEVISFTGDGTESGLTGLADSEGTAVFSLPEPEVEIERAVFDHAEVMPQYEGGLEAMMKFIQRKIRYPRGPRATGVDGTVYVRFIVQGDGSVTDVEILRGVHPDYDREALRVVGMLPAWKGGSHNGRPAAVRMVLPIKFNLQ